MRGDKPTPDAVLRLRGSRKINRDGRRVPPPAKGLQHLDPPQPLTGEHARLWASVTSYMCAHGTLGQVSPHVLQRYVDLLAAWESMGNEQHDPHTRITQRCRISPCLSKLEAALGLDPASRRGIVPAEDKPEKKDPLAALMND